MTGRRQYSKDHFDTLRLWSYLGRPVINSYGTARIPASTEVTLNGRGNFSTWQRGISGWQWLNLLLRNSTQGNKKKLAYSSWYESTWSRYIGIPMWMPRNSKHCHSSVKRPGSTAIRCLSIIRWTREPLHGKLVLYEGTVVPWTVRQNIQKRQ